MEAELAARLGRQVPGSDQPEPPRTLEDELYGGDGEFARKVDAELGPSWVAGIAEVPLSLEQRLKNIEGTEAAKEAMLVKSGMAGCVRWVCVRSCMDVPACVPWDEGHRLALPSVEWRGDGHPWHAPFRLLVGRGQRLRGKRGLKGKTSRTHMLSPPMRQTRPPWRRRRQCGGQGRGQEPVPGVFRQAGRGNDAAHRRSAVCGDEWHFPGGRRGDRAAAWGRVPAAACLLDVRCIPLLHPNSKLLRRSWTAHRILQGGEEAETDFLCGKTGQEEAGRPAILVATPGTRTLPPFLSARLQAKKMRCPCQQCLLTARWSAVAMRTN